MAYIISYQYIARHASRGMHASRDTYAYTEQHPARWLLHKRSAWLHNSSFEDVQTIYAVIEVPDGLLTADEMDVLQETVGE